MKFVIADQKTFDVSSEHDSLDEARRIYLDYFRECVGRRQQPDNWIFKRRDDGEFISLPSKKETELRRFFIDNI